MSTRAVGGISGAVPVRTERRRAAVRARGKRFKTWHKVALALFAAGYVIVPTIVQAAHTHAPRSADQQVAAQYSVPIPHVRDDLVARLKALPVDTTGTGPPIIMTYHNVTDDPSSPYSVKPEQFAAQMALLDAAGYTTITASDLERWLAGGKLPPHSVLLTFDDGILGVWQYADKILAQHHQHAIAFVITGNVGTKASYYMTWPELERLQRSGRWDLESHTSKGHHYITVDAQRHQGPFMNNLQYLAAEHRVETLPEYTNRITADLMRSQRDLRAHGADPVFFAYPFSANSSSPAVSAALAKTVSQLFRGAMLDEDGSAITTPADTAAGNLRRVDVLWRTSLDDYVAHIESSTLLPPASVPQPFTRPDLWTTASGKPYTPALVGDELAVDPAQIASGSNWVGLQFAADRTAFWREFTIAATLGGFQGKGDGTTTGLRVFSGSSAPVQVSLGWGSLQVRQGTYPHDTVLADDGLPPAAAYDVVVSVHANVLEVDVDGHPMARLPMDPRVAVGGFELTGQRAHATSPVPVVSKLAVRP